MSRLTKIFLALLFTTLTFAQPELLLLMGDDGIGEYPITADLLHSYDEREMTISSWADQTGTLDFAQATETNQPVLNESALNGYPGLTFDGSDNYMKTASVTINQPFTFYLVVKAITWTDSDRLISAGGEFSVTQGGGVSGLAYMFAGAYEPRKILTVGSYVIASCVFNNTSSEFGVNGADTTTNTVGADGINGGIHLCSYITPSNYGNFEVVALYLHSTAHDLATRTTIIDWLNSKYAIY